MIETIHRQAILKLINYFTRTPSNHDAQTTTNSNSSSGEAQLYRFKEPCDFINLPSITRLGAVISKFDQFFRPSGHLLEAAHSLKSPYNSVNILYLQQITELVQFIELNLFDSIPNIRNERINVDTSQALQSSEHLHALILIIKDWIQQFYIDDTNILPSIFPVLNEERTIFKLVDITENNICVWAILIFNVIYKLRDCFPEYTHVLDFSWSFLFYATMENLADVVRFDSNFISSLLQTSLLYARMEEEQERQTYAAQYKQIETLQAKIVETKKRSQALLMSHAGGGVGGKGGAGKGLGNSAALISSATNITQIAVPQMGTAAAMRTITGGGAGGTKNSRAKAGGKRGAAGGGFHSTVAGSSASTATTNTTSNALLNEKPYHCHSCNKTFPTSYKLNRHAYSHSGERPYQCTWPNCEKRFNDNYHLRRHTNTHTGDKPFPCKYPGCSKRYSRSEDLRNHQKTHYPNSGGGGGGGVGGSIMTHNHQTNTATNHNNVPIDEHKFNLIAVQQHQQQQQQQQQQSQSNNPSSSQQLSSIAVPTQQYASLPVVTTSMVVAAHPHQAPLPMSSKAAAQAAVAAAAVSATAVTPDQVLVLNQLHMQLQQQHQQQVQQQQQQQQQSNNTFSSMSPVLSDETTTSLLLAQEQQQQQQQQSTAASAAQNHVQAGLHSIADYNF